MPLAGRRLLLGVSGGIAAYKACELVRRLRERGAEVRVVMTEAATRFISPLTLQALSGQPVRTSLWDEAAEAAMGHIELARWAERVLVAPASANLMARLAAGMADDLLATLCLATEAPVLLAPAMNRQMWAHPATQANVAQLVARGVALFGPAAGAQACGEVGAGRLLEPAELVEQVVRHFERGQMPAGRLAGKRVVITAGPTREPLDPVRFLSNRSSGRMGYALAEAARALGAGEVVLVSGPTALPVPPGVVRVAVETALQMHGAVQQALPCDLFVATAAVADYRPETVAAGKIKKAEPMLELRLVRNPDIVAGVAARPDRPFVVGFAAETDDVVAHAHAKRVGKRLDLIAANRVGPGLGFDQPDNALTVLWQGGQVELGPADKGALARTLMELIAERMETHATYPAQDS